jgi:hypothetical protein
MAGTTGLEPATSAVTAKRKRVTNRKQGATDDTFSALRSTWELLLHPYRTHDLCPDDLCLPTNHMKLKTYTWSIKNTGFGVGFLPAVHATSSQRRRPYCRTARLFLPLSGGRPSKSPHDYGCTHAITIIVFRLKR